MVKYRIDREIELFRDVLLTEKEKLIIKVITTCQDLKKENEQLRKKNTGINLPNSTKIN